MLSNVVVVVIVIAVVVDVVAVVADIVVVVFGVIVSYVVVVVVVVFPRFPDVWVYYPANTIKLCNIIFLSKFVAKRSNQKKGEAQFFGFFPFGLFAAFHRWSFTLCIFCYS
jgi:hypothetical protein